MMPVDIATAQRYLAAGLAVVPPREDGTKAPDSTWQRYQDRLPTITEIERWYSPKRDGIGVVCGAGSGGLEMFELEGAAVADGMWEAFKERAQQWGLGDTLARITEGYMERTPSGGIHLLLRTEGAPLGNLKLARRPEKGTGAITTLIETRGQGGFTILAPSGGKVHGTGRKWVVESGDIATIATISTEDRDAIYELARTFDEVDPPAPEPDEGHWETVSTAPPNTEGWITATIDDYNNSTTWAGLLVGWTHHHSRGGIDYWTRPGKAPKHGHSATTNGRGTDRLTVFSSSVHPGLEAWTGAGKATTYDRFSYYTITEHAGDRVAAARTLRSQGYGPSPTEIAKAEPWPTPAAMPGVAPLPEFPVDSLPDWTQAHALAAAEQVQVPVDLTAMLTIGALSAACTGRAKVHVSAAWVEPVCLYLVTAMRSGAGKSPADKLTVGWLHRWERQRIEAIATARAEAIMLHRHADKKLRKLEGGMGDQSDLLAAMRDAQRAEAEIPPLPRLITDDATPEQVAILLKAHGERLAVLSTEADLFDMLLRGKPGQRASVNVYLKAWSGDSMRRDRKGGSESGPEETLLTSPLLTVAVSVQPSVLARLQGDDELVGRGFAARFMFSLPADLIGSRDPSKRFSSVKMPTLGPYEATAVARADRWATWEHPADLRLSTEGARRLEDFLVEIEPQLAAGGDLEHLAEWANKLHASVARYAGLLWLSEDGDSGTPIDGDTMARAITLGRYWLAHARAVLDIDTDRTAEQAQAILTWAAANARDFTIADLQKKIRRPGIGLDKAVDYVPPLELLVELGWVRPVDNGDWAGQVGVNRTRSPRFALWPDCPQSPTVRDLSAYPRTACMGERDSLPSLSGSDSPTPSTRYADTRITQSAPPVDNSDPDHDPDHDWLWNP